MGPDPSRVIGSIVRPVEADGSTVAQRKVEASDELRRARIRQEHERRRREMERKLRKAEGKEEPEDETGGLDVLV